LTKNRDNSTRFFQIKQSAEIGKGRSEFMKNGIIATVLLVLLSASLASCSENGTSDTKTAESDTPAAAEQAAAGKYVLVDEYSAGKGDALLYMGMSEKDAWDILITGVMADSERGGSDFWSPIDDGTHHDVELDGIYYISDKNGTLYDLSVWSGLFTTKAGLCVGDTALFAGGLYGDEYTLYTDTYYGDEMREYTTGENYLAVYLTDGAVSRWGVSKYSEDFKRGRERQGEYALPAAVEIPITREGETETFTAALNTSSKGYAIYLLPEFLLVPGGAYDLIRPEPDSKILSSINMRVYKSGEGSEITDSAAAERVTLETGAFDIYLYYPAEAAEGGAVTLRAMLGTMAAAGTASAADEDRPSNP
jgi:hypothetical protein